MRKPQNPKATCVKKVPQKTLTDTKALASDVRESKKSKKKKALTGGQKEKKTRKTLMNSSLDSLSFGSFFILYALAQLFSVREFFFFDAPSSTPDDWYFSSRLRERETIYTVKI